MLSYLYHFILVRMLTPEIYGSLSVILGVFTIFIIPTQSIQRIIARDVAKLRQKGLRGEIRFVFRKSLGIVFIIGVVIGVFLMATSFIVSSFYGESDLRLPIQVLAVLAPLWYVLHVFKGYIQGMEMMVVLSITIIIEQVVKLLLGFVLVWLGYGLFGAAAPIGSGVFLAIPFTLLFCIKGIRGEVKRYAYAFKSSFAKIFATDILLMIFIFLDLFFVKKVLGSADAGYYNTASLTSKVLVSSMFGVMFAFLPRASKLNIGKDWAKIRVLILKSAVIVFPLFIILFLFPTQVITISFTEAYLPAVPPLRILLAAMFLFGLFNIPLNLMWSQHEENFPLLLAAMIILVDAALLYLLVPRLGLVGAAYSTAVSALILLAAAFMKINSMRHFNEASK